MMDVYGKCIFGEKLQFVNLRMLVLTNFSKLLLGGLCSANPAAALVPGWGGLWSCGGPKPCRKSWSSCLGRRKALFFGIKGAGFLPHLLWANPAFLYKLQTYNSKPRGEDL